MPTLQLALARVLRHEDAPASFFSPEDFRTNLLNALDPEVSTERYGRTWRISRPQPDGDWVTGRLGFSSPTVTDSLFYSEEDQDFVETEEQYATGAVSNFAVHVQTQFVVFQLVGRDIRPFSFVGALKDIISGPLYRLTVERVSDARQLSDWLDTVDRVSEVRISLRRPNPDFSHAPESVRRLIEQTNAARTHMTLTADSEGSGLEINGSDLRGYAEFAEAGFGDIRAKATAGTRNRVYDSKRHVPQETTQIEDLTDLAALMEALKRIGMAMIERFRGNSS